MWAITLRWLEQGLPTSQQGTHPTLCEPSSWGDWNRDYLQPSRELTQPWCEPSPWGDCNRGYLHPSKEHTQPWCEPSPWGHCEPLTRGDWYRGHPNGYHSCFLSKRSGLNSQRAETLDSVSVNQSHCSQWIWDYRFKCTGPVWDVAIGAHKYAERLRNSIVFYFLSF